MKKNTKEKGSEYIGLKEFSEQQHFHSLMLLPA